MTIWFSEANGGGGLCSNTPDQVTSDWPSKILFATKLDTFRIVVTFL